MDTNPAIIVAAISAAAALTGTLVTALFAMFGSVYKLRLPKKTSILEHQLLKIFAPLQKVMLSNLSAEEKNRQAKTIMEENFVLVPNEMYEARESDAFPAIVEACYNLSRKKLGYTQVVPPLQLDSLDIGIKAEKIIAPRKVCATPLLKGSRNEKPSTFADPSALRRLVEASSAKTAPATKKVFH